MSSNTPLREQQATSVGMKRRDLLLGASALIAAGAVAPSGFRGLLSGSAHAAEATKPPHIIYIVSDDQGSKDAGFRGSDIKTPNLDALAGEGAELTQFYTQPFCTQTRAAMLTGRYPLRYGLQTGVIPSGGLYGLATDEWLLPQALKEAGYTTSMVGKWHVGHAKQEFWPRQRGFDSFYGAMVGEIDYFTHSAHGVKDWYRENEVISEEGYSTTLFGDEAVKVIEGHDAATPLYMYLAFNAPHTPFQAPQDYIDRYADIADENRRTYAAMITCLDEQVGRVVAALEAKGMRENTLIVYHADNGGTRSAKFTGESVVTGELPPRNDPYRDGKATLYEGGTRVVAFANWPGKIKAGKVDGMMHVVDWYPTLVGLAGGSLEKTKPLDGMDMWATVSEGVPSPRTELVYNVDPTIGAVRQGDWKLVWTALLPTNIELFNLKEDVVEANNVAEANPDQVKALQDRIKQLAIESQPPLLMADAIRSVFSAPPSTPQDLFTISD